MIIVGNDLTLGQGNIAYFGKYIFRERGKLDDAQGTGNVKNKNGDGQLCRDESMPDDVLPVPSRAERTCPMASS